MVQDDTKLRVRSIELINKEGSVCGVISTFNGNPGIHLYDKNGFFRIAVGINDASVSGVTLYDAKGVPVANLCCHADGSTAMEFCNSHPNYRTALSLDNYTSIGQPRLVFLDKEGRIRHSTNNEDKAGDFFLKGVPDSLCACPDSPSKPKEDGMRDKNGK